MFLKVPPLHHQSHAANTAVGLSSSATVLTTPALALCWSGLQRVHYDEQFGQVLQWFHRNAAAWWFLGTCLPAEEVGMHGQNARLVVVFARLVVAQVQLLCKQLIAP